MSCKTVLIHIFLNISRSKGNRRTKFGQVIECNIRNIFLEKLYTKCDGETSPKPYSGKLKLSISGSIVLGFTQFVFIVCQVE